MRPSYKRAVVLGVCAASAVALTIVSPSVSQADDASTLTIVGTSDVFDSNLVQAVLKPGFEAAIFQFNVSNLTDEEYFGTISSGVGGTPGVAVQCLNETTGATVNCVGQTGSVGFFSIGAPRTATASIRLKF